MKNDCHMNENHIALCSLDWLPEKSTWFRRYYKYLKEWRAGRWPCFTMYQFSSVQSLSCVQLFATPCTTACQASLSITNSRSLLKLMSIELVMPSNHLILCHPLLLLPLIFTSIRVFSNELVLSIRWPKYWSFSFSISPSNECLGLISFRIDWLDLFVSKGLSRVFSNTTVQNNQRTYGILCSV